MADGNVAVAFGALVAGAVVLDYGVKAFKSNLAPATGTDQPAPGMPATGSVAQAISYTKSLIGTPYVFGGGHQSNAFTETVQAIRQGGLDCSGLVSQALGPRGLGVLTTPETTQTLYDAPGIMPGAGQQVTIYDRHTGASNDEHVIIQMAGQWFESGGMLGGGVQQMTPVQAQTELSGGNFQAYHPEGY